MSGPVPVRDDLLEVAPYGAPQLSVPVRLNVNETSEAPPPEFAARVAAALTSLELNRYPDRPASALREALGKIEDLPPERVWVANGSNEILLQLFLAYGGPGRRMLLVRPGYSAHPLIARVSGTATVEHDLGDDFTLTPRLAAEAVAAHDPDLVVVASPNNPTGVSVGVDAVRALHDSRALVVVDEAYVEFGADTCRPLLEQLPRLVVTRTFSKAYRLAGLRLGYLLGHDWVVDDLRKVRLPYHLDAVKQAAGLAALQLRDLLLDHVARVAAERDRVRGALETMPGVDRVWPSSANFILFRCEVRDLFTRLLDRGVLIRDFSDQARLAGCLRVSTGTPAENDAFLAALREVLEEARA